MTASQAKEQQLRVLWVALSFVAAAVAGIAPSADGDIWWHLAAGREIVERGQLLYSDPFSTGAVGRPWPDVHWLFQLAAYAVHSQLGLAGLVWAKCLVVGVGACVLLGSVEWRPGSWSRGLFVTLLAAALFAARALLLVRPVIVTLLFIALFYRVLEGVRRNGRLRPLLALPLIQIVWVNCQGLSVLGLALVGTYLLGSILSNALGNAVYWPFARRRANGRAREQSQMLAVTFAACGLASGLTPFGFAGFALPAKLFARLLPNAGNVFAHSVAENVAPFSLEQWSGEFWHLKWALAVLGLAVWWGGRRVQVTHALLLAGLAALALLSNRNVLLLYWLGTPIAASYLAPALRARLLRVGGRGARPWAVGLNAATLAGLLCLSGVAAAREPSLQRPTPFRMPEASVQALARLPGGSVFSADHQGGYLIWSLYPRFRPYIDTRLVLRTPEEYSEYLAVTEEPERFAALQAREHFSYAILPVAYPDRYLRLIGALATNPEWKLVFTNGSEVVFARRDIPTPEVQQPGDPALTARLLAQLDGDYAGSPALRNAAQLQLATLQLALGEFDEAERVLSRSSGPEAAALRARSCFGAGRLADAEAITRDLLRGDSADASSLNLMALIAIARSDRKAAILYLRRAADHHPFDPETNQILANLEDNR